MAYKRNYVSEGLYVGYDPDGTGLTLTIGTLSGDYESIIVLVGEIDDLIKELRAVKHSLQYREQKAEEQAALERWIAGQPTPTEVTR